MIVLARDSKTQTGEVRILRNPNVQVGKTAGPMQFDNQKLANAYVKEHSLDGFYAMTLGKPKKSGSKKGTK